MTKKESESTMEALHLQAAGKHIVGVKALHVLLIPDGGHWFAQGLEIDYAAYGSSLAAAKENFSNGLAKTIIEHLSMHGDIEKLLQVAGKDVWEEYYNAPPEAVKSSLTQIQATEITKQLPKPKKSALSVFPFEVIHFLKGATAAKQASAAVA